LGDLPTREATLRRVIVFRVTEPREPSTATGDTTEQQPADRDSRATDDVDDPDDADDRRADSWERL
jgi:hypothetical protein